MGARQDIGAGGIEVEYESAVLDVQAEKERQPTNKTAASFRPCRAVGKEEGERTGGSPSSMA